MIIELKVPDSLMSKLNRRNLLEFQHFLQGQVNRYCVGELRYGAANANKRYMTRLGKEFRAYKSGGNAEQLFNIAVYAFLESCKPENKKLYFDPNAASMTRDEMGGEVS